MITLVFQNDLSGILSGGWIKMRTKIMPTSTKIMTHFITMLTLLQWSGTEFTISLSCAGSRPRCRW